MKTNKIELRPCPFCGKHVASVSTVQNAEGCKNEDSELLCPAYEAVPFVCRMFLIVCNGNWGGCGASTGYCNTKKDAIDAWNRRSS